MRTILGFVPALVCAGAMVFCVRMMLHKPKEGGASASRDTDRSESVDG